MGFVSRVLPDEFIRAHGKARYDDPVVDPVSLFYFIIGFTASLHKFGAEPTVELRRAGSVTISLVPA